MYRNRESFSGLRRVNISKHQRSDLRDYTVTNKGFPGGSDGKESARKEGDQSSIPESGRSLGEENGNPLLNSCLENPMDGRAWRATVHRVTKSWTQLSNFIFTFSDKQIKGYN